MHKPLRILMIVDLAWDARLGAIRVFMGLADAWRAAGHQVEKYCLEDAFPAPAQSRALALFRQLAFPWKAAEFVRANHARFEVIDSLVGTMPFPKQRLQFDGLLVARSVGLYHLYRELAQTRGAARRGRLLGQMFYPVFEKTISARSQRAVRNCDLLNLPNEQELQALQAQLGTDKAVIVEPYGLTSERRREFAQAALPAAERLAKKKIAFIGMWSPRKGAKDFGKIVRLVRAAVPDARFLFLGTLVEDRQVLRDLGLRRADFIQLAADYRPGQLPQLLADCTVGAFPSYAEAFGFAVLEQLATGIPCVAYDSAGPAMMLKRNLPDLLVPVGNVEEFAAKIVHVLRCDSGGYETLSRRSAQIAARFDWATIAEQTAEAYRTHLP